jgi:hypothetical protein
MTALAATASCELTNVKFDIDSMDALIVPRGGKRLVFGVQMKATSTDCVTAEQLTYALPIKNYHDLRLGETAAPSLLVVVHLPPNEPDWIAHGESALILKNDAYYLNLLDEPDTTNTDNITIRIPAAQKLTTTSLRTILEYLATNKVLPK